jgi:hypothetical protein
VDYSKIVEMIPAEKWGPVSDQLTNFLLTSKNDEKMPSQLANTLLLHMKNGVVKSKQGITVLLEGAMLLEPEKTLAAFGEMQMANVADEIKKMWS